MINISHRVLYGRSDISHIVKYRVLTGTIHGSDIRSYKQGYYLTIL